MRIKKLLFLITLCFLTSNLRAQVNRSLSLELAGLGGFYSFNYDFTTLNKLNYRSGISFVPRISYVSENTGFVIPLSITKLLKTGTASHIEMGVGSSIGFSQNELGNFLSLIIGLRGQDKFGESTFYKLTAYPSYRTTNNPKPFITFGLTIGKSF